MAVRTRVLALAAGSLLVAALGLWTYDVHVPITGNGPPRDSFCGSAYDVVFLKKNGYMGGEMPANQDRIDGSCSSSARRYVAGAGVAGTAGLALLVGTVVAGSRRSGRVTKSQS